MYVHCLLIIHAFYGIYTCEMKCNTEYINFDRFIIINQSLIRLLVVSYSIDAKLLTKMEIKEIKIKVYTYTFL